MIVKLLSIVQFYGLQSIVVVFREIKFQISKFLPWVDFLIAKPYGINIKVPVKIGGIGRVLYVLRGREEDHKWMLENILFPEDIVFDIGANIGYYVLLEEKIMQGKGKIYAVEPDPRNIFYLTRNIKEHNLEDFVVIEECGISDKNDVLEFSLSDRTNLSHIGFVADKNASLVKIKVHKFSEYVLNIGKIDLVRMDVEGHEVEILFSLMELLNNNKQACPKKIIFETHKYNEQSTKMASVLMSLLCGGYQLKFMSSDDENNPDGALFRKMGYKPIKVINEWGVSRGIYKDIKRDDAISLISNHAGTRTVCIELTDL